MTISLSDLLTARTADQILDDTLARLQAGGYPVTNWEPGGTALTQFRVFGELQAEKEGKVVPALARAGFLDLCSGDWLTFVAKEQYGLNRFPATYAQQRIRLSCSQGVGPYAVSPGDLRVEYEATQKVFELATGGTIPTNSYVDLTFRAESPGASYNCQYGTITKLVTSLPGVAVNNPNRDYSDVAHAGYGSGTVTPSAAGSPGNRTFKIKIASTGQVGAATFQWRTDAESAWSTPIATADTFAIPGRATTIAFANGGASPSFVAGDVYTFVSPGSPLLVVGTDQETDASLRQRCRDRLAERAANLVDGKLRNWARAASMQVTRAMPAAVGDGTVTLTVSGPDGPVSATAVDEVQVYINALLDDTDSVTVQSATARTVNAGGTVQIAAALLAAAQKKVDDDWRAYVQETDVGGVVRMAKLQQLLMDAGARDVTALSLNAAASNVTLAAAEVAACGTLPSAGITWQTY